jgi:DNA uptake protein ComE-like DNA-binding protein
MKNKLTFVVALIGLLAVAPLTAQAQSTKKKTSTPSSTTNKKASTPDHLTPATEKEKADAKKAASKLTPTQKTKLLTTLNKGKKEELMELPTVGEARAANLTKARPFKAVEDIIDVTGIGLDGLNKIIAHAKAPKKPEVKKPVAKKPEVKKPATKK